MTSSAAAAARLARVPGTATSLGRGRHGTAPPSPATALRDKATADQCWPAIASTHLAKSLSYLIHKYENIFFQSVMVFRAGWAGGNINKLKIAVNFDFKI